MGSRARRRDRERRTDRQSKFRRALGAAGVVLAVVSGVVGLVAGGSLWVLGACWAVVVFSALAWHRDDFTSARVLLTGAGVFVIGALAARGAYDLIPWRAYEGRFIVVGSSVVIPRSVPIKNGVGPSFSYDAGDMVIVECQTRGLDNPRAVWYRVKDEHVYLSADDVVPDGVKDPGTPPTC